MARLVVITGPMFSGKTSNLLIQLSRASAIYGGKTMYVTHDCDRRKELTAEESVIGSHSLMTRCGFGAADIHLRTNLVSKIDEEDNNDDISAIGIDEAQFFDGKDLFETVSKWCNGERSKLQLIIVAGLDGDSNQQPFVGSAIPSLLPISDEFSKLETAKCIKCIKTGMGVRPAPFTIKNSKNNILVDVGGDDKYSAVCREHLN